MPSSKTIGIAIGGALALFGAIQLVPYGRAHTNPPTTGEPTWDSPRTEALAKRACYDCHSNETVWPWYSNIAPFSWAVQEHVDEAREKLNFSEWDKPQHDADEAAEAVREGWMPPKYYTSLHSSARLTASELADLANGLEASLGGEEHEHPATHGDDDDD